MLRVGDKMPAFTSVDQDGNAFSSKQLAGKEVIIFFYPRDNTPGCTAEACSLRDNFKEFTDLGYLLIGVSPDEPQKHQKFISKFQLPFPLIADVERKVIDKFGVWGPKKFMGRTFDGVYRTTFIINKKGIVSHIFEKVKSKQHAAQIMEALQVK